MPRQERIFPVRNPFIPLPYVLTGEKRGMGSLNLLISITVSFGSSSAYLESEKRHATVRRGGFQAGFSCLPSTLVCFAFHVRHRENESKTHLVVGDERRDEEACRPSLIDEPDGLLN